MKRIFYGGDMANEISPETAMKWFCWHEVVEAMEKDSKTLSEVSRIMNSRENINIPNWEEKFLLTFLERTETDLIV